MQITPEFEDDPAFVAIVERVVDGLLQRDTPPSLVLVKIDNWFGPKWLSFSGKALGAIAVWKATLTIPPFVPNRVVYQKRYAAPTYQEVDSGKPLHSEIPAGAAITRRASEVAPGAALVWYSGNSRETGRGSVMAYVPEAQSYWSWYADWACHPSWHIAKAIGIKPGDLQNLIHEELSRTASPN
jgi:hypothetical protein